MSPYQHDSDHRTGIYASTPTDGMDSMNEQLEAARSYAEQTGLDVVAQYIDLLGQLPQFLQVLADAAEDGPPCRRIPVHNLSRVSWGAAKINHLLSTLVIHCMELLAVAERFAGPLISARNRYLSKAVTT